LDPLDLLESQDREETQVYLDIHSDILAFQEPLGKKVRRGKVVKLDPLDLQEK
jgi:hypothetical protein